MSVKITYFVHGTTIDNENKIASGWSDVELSELGKEQAANLQELVKDKDFDAVFCSDLKRAIETAQISFSNFKIIQDKRLRECNYGDFNGKGSKVVEELETQCIKNPFPNGESFFDVERRLRDFLNYLKENFDDKKIAIVAHKAPQLALDVILKNKTWEQAFSEDWRKKEPKEWRPGWDYNLI